METSRCFGGSNPIPLADSDICHPGFYCPNSTAENPPEYCQPTIECLTIRLGQFTNTCPEPQGIYEPVVCPPGFYCPPDGRSRIQCPPEHFCPLGTAEPFRCMRLSICPEGSTREFHLVGFLAIILADILLLAGLRLLLANTFGDFFSQFYWLRQSEKQAYSEDYQHGQSETSPSGWELTEALMQSLALKDTGIEIGFRDLEFCPDKNNPPIIQGLSGNIPRGAFLGIMGPSGAGKTTLMNILAGKTCQTAGTTTLNGAEEDLSRFKQLVGFVPQADAALAELTVRENVLLSARIQLGGVKEDAFIKQHVESIMSCMGLEHIQNNIVGDPTTGKRISGGERRRVSIALRLVAMPLALLLDEPTSGLDASTALSIMRLLESISRMGVTVVCVIHQPRAEIFEMLHHLLLLDHTSQVYMGNAGDMKAHFEARGYNISDRVNPADAIMDILSSDTELLPPNEDIQGMAPVETCCSHARIETLNALSEIVASRKARWYRQCSLHLVRGLRQQIRQTTTSVVGLIVGAISGLVMGLAVYKFDGNLFHGIFRHPFEPLSSAVAYTLVPQLALLSCLAISLAAAPAGVETFGEKNNFYREADAGDSRSAYFVGKELSTIPRIVLSALHFTTFYIILATPAISFGMLLVLNMLFFYCVYGLSSAVAALVQRENALFLSLLLCLIVGICNGYGPLLSSVKSWNLEWFWYLCPGTWFAEAYFTEHVERFAYLYDTESAAKFTGYVAGRTGFDGGILLLIGTVYRVFAYILLSLPTTQGYRWVAGRFAF